MISSSASAGQSAYLAVNNYGIFSSAVTGRSLHVNMTFPSATGSYGGSQGQGQGSRHRQSQRVADRVRARGRARGGSRGARGRGGQQGSQARAGVGRRRSFTQTQSSARAVASGQREQQQVSEDLVDDFRLVECPWSFFLSLITSRGGFVKEEEMCQSALGVYCGYGYGLRFFCCVCVLLVESGKSHDADWASGTDILNQSSYDRLSKWCCTYIIPWNQTKCARSCVVCAYLR